MPYAILTLKKLNADIYSNLKTMMINESLKFLGT